MLSQSLQPTSNVTANVAIVAVDCMSGKVHTALLEEGASRSGLESVLLQTCPAEMLLAESLTSPTAKLLTAWTGNTSDGGGSGGGARVERFKRGRFASPPPPPPFRQRFCLAMLFQFRCGDTACVWAGVSCIGGGWPLDACSFAREIMKPRPNHRRINLVTCFHNREGGAARASVAAFFADHPAAATFGDKVLQMEDLVVEGLSHVISYLRCVQCMFEPGMATTLKHWSVRICRTLGKSYRGCFPVVLS